MLRTTAYLLGSPNLSTRKQTSWNSARTAHRGRYAVKARVVTRVKGCPFGSAMPVLPSRAFTVQPYGKTARARFNVAVGEVANDRADVFVAPKKGRRGRVKVINGRTGAIVRSFFAFGRGYSGGVALAAADLIGDGNAYIIAGRASGRRSRIEVVDSTTGRVFRTLIAFEREFHRGLSLSARDVNDDGVPDIVATSRGRHATLVEVFDGRTAAGRRDPETAGRPGEVVRRRGVAALIASGERKAFGQKHLYDLLRPDIRGGDRGRTRRSRPDRRRS